MNYHLLYALYDWQMPLTYLLCVEVVICRLNLLTYPFIAHLSPQIR